MSQTITPHDVRPASRPSTLRTVARWMISFAGFPLGGVAAMVTVGPIDSMAKAVVGGLASGLVLGAIQGWALRWTGRADRRLLMAWAAATAVGLATGLAIGASIVGFGTDLGDLLVQGAISGLAVGTAQAAVLVRRTGPIALLWPAWLSAVWAIGWTVTTAIGVEVDDRFTVFGSSGAVTAALLTAVLPLYLNHKENQS